MDDQTIRTMAQFLTTEHSALQNARNAVVVESNGRTASFLTTISASIVALALVSQISRFGEVFLLFSLVLIPTLSFIGISAYVRMVQLDFSDFVLHSSHQPHPPLLPRDHPGDRTIHQLSGLR